MILHKIRYIVTLASIWFFWTISSITLYFLLLLLFTYLNLFSMIQSLLWTRIHLYQLVLRLIVSLLIPDPFCSYYHTSYFEHLESSFHHIYCPYLFAVIRWRLDLIRYIILKVFGSYRFFRKTTKSKNIQEVNYILKEPNNIQYIKI